MMSQIIFRSFPKSFILSFLVCLGIIFFVALAASAESYRHQQTGITLPDNISDSLYLWRVTDFEKDHPGAGIGVSYRHRQQLIRVDIYFYNNKLPDIPYGITGTVENEMKNILQGLKYQNLTMVIPKEIVPVSAVPFLHCSLTYSQNDTGWISHRYLTGFRNHFVKIYSTYMADRAAEGERLTAALLQTIGNALAK